MGERTMALLMPWFVDCQGIPPNCLQAFQWCADDGAGLQAGCTPYSEGRAVRTHLTPRRRSLPVHIDRKESER